MEILLVRKSGPVQSMTFRTWWIYFLFMLLILMLLGLGAGSYILYRQQRTLRDLAEDTHLLMLRTERLEALVQEQETRTLLAQEAARQAAAQKPVPKAAAPAKPKPQPPAPAPKATKPAPPPPPPAPPAPKPAPAAKPQPAAAKSPEAELVEPTSSDVVAIRDIKVRRRGGELLVYFNVTNKRPPSEKAVGYATLVMRGTRGGKPWIEAWPPMRLSPLGRPLNYRRGTPFSVQYRRPLKATFVVADKKFERMEFLVYSRKGELILVHSLPLGANNQPEGKTNSGTKTP